MSTEQDMTADEALAAINDGYEALRDEFVAAVEQASGGKGYMLMGVPGRTGILIHPGNWCGDKAKGLKSDVQGCILLGLGIGELCGQRAITDSRAAVKAFIEDMGGSDFELTIEWGV